MSAHLPVTRQSLGRTFMVAAFVLGVIGFAQVVAVGWRFAQSPTAPAEATNGGGEAVRIPPQKIDINRLITDMPPPEEPPLSVVEDPLDVEPVTVGPTGMRPVPIATPLERRSPPEPEEPETPSPTVVASVRPGVPPRPTPVPLSALTPKVSPQFTELVEQGKLLRNSGDTAGALVKFREASTLEPTNAQAIAEQAYTFEKMSLYDKAAEQWRRVLNLGENGGVLYSAAKSKLDMAKASIIRDLSPSGAPRALQEGKSLGLGTPVARDESDPASDKKFVLHVPIMARAGQKVSVRDMKVFVMFYDRLNAKDIASTAANVSNRWESPPANWTDSDVETLEVTYDLPRADGRGERREFYGYIVRLYYQNQLQDTYAEPAALNQRFPAALTLTD